VVAIQGADETGKYVEEVLTGPKGAEVVLRYDEILGTRQPHYRRGVLATSGREHIHDERVAFPLPAMASMCLC